MDIKNIQPTTAFELKGAFLVTLFPSMFQGFTSVLCGDQKGIDDCVHVIHDCTLCKAYGYKNCPYIKQGIKAYMIYKGKRYTSFKITQQPIKASMYAKLNQIPVPTVDDKKVNKREKQHTA